MTPGRSSLEMIEQCLARVSDADGEGTRAFLDVYSDKARVVARASDVLRANGYAASPIAGMPLSIKDLLDVSGEITRAGSRALDDALPAKRDAPVVQRLKSAGAILVGRTNMTPFAYSLVGLNAQFGTPANPWDRNHIPGGSSSGAAVSVADGMAMAAIGSDTVGSIRVPAAFCGVVGFKPTQQRVPREGSIPLSATLDCLGPLANSISDCVAVFEVITGEPAPAFERESVAGMRLAIPEGPFLDGLDHEVASAFGRAIGQLAKAGALVVEKRVSSLTQALASEGTRIIQSVEAYTWHAELLGRRGDDYDAQIRMRIENGRHVSASSYAAVLARRSELIAAFDRELGTVDALVLPTSPIIAPTFAEAFAHEDAIRSRLLRNTAPFSLLDCCAISLPIHELGAAPVGLTLAGRKGSDWHLLAVASVVEATLSELRKGY